MNVNGIVKIKKAKLTNEETIMGVLYFISKAGKEITNETIGFTYLGNKKKLDALLKKRDESELFELTGRLCKSDKGFYVNISQLEVCSSKYKKLGMENTNGNLELEM